MRLKSQGLVAPDRYLLIAGVWIFPTSYVLNASLFLFVWRKGWRAWWRVVRSFRVRALLGLPGVLLFFCVQERKGLEIGWTCPRGFLMSRSWTGTCVSVGVCMCARPWAWSWSLFFRRSRYGNWNGKQKSKLHGLVIISIGLFQVVVCLLKMGIGTEEYKIQKRSLRKSKRRGAKKRALICKKLMVTRGMHGWYSVVRKNNKDPTQAPRTRSRYKDKVPVTEQVSWEITPRRLRFCLSENSTAIHVGLSNDEKIEGRTGDKDGWCRRQMRDQDRERIPWFSLEKLVSNGRRVRREEENQDLEFDFNIRLAVVEITGLDFKSTLSAILTNTLNINQL